MVARRTLPSSVPRRLARRVLVATAVAACWALVPAQAPAALLDAPEQPAEAPGHPQPDRPGIGLDVGAVPPEPAPPPRRASLETEGAGQPTRPTAPDAPTVTDPGTADPTARMVAAFEAAVPAEWRAAVPVSLSLGQGTSSRSWPDGRLMMTAYHVNGPWDRLQAIVAHEFAHHVAFRFGTGAELGAPPAGWPAAGQVPVEHWADCVARAFTGFELASHGQHPCEGPALTWTATFLEVVPA